jgi:hypothetical protein
MARRLLRGLTFSNVCSFLALTIALGTGTAYAANTVGSDDIINESIQSVDLKAGGVINSDLGADAVNSAKVLDDSITSADLGTNSVGATEIADDTIDSGEIIDNSLGSQDLASSSVGSAELASDSVTGTKVASESLTLSDLLGADRTGGISYSMGANACSTLTFGVSGAQVGQVVLMSTTGTVSPGDVVFGPMRVTAANTIVARACNQSSSSVSVSDLGVRFVTFG